MPGYKVGIIVRKDITIEQKQEIESHLKKRFGEDCEIGFLTPNEYEVGPAQPISVILDDDISSIPIKKCYDISSYTPIDKPSKKAQRISPYAKYDKFHHNRKKRK